MGDKLVNFNIDYIAFGLAGGTFEVRGVSDSYIEALQMSLDNHLPVPLPDGNSGLPSIPGRLFATGYGISEDTTIVAATFGDPRQKYFTTGRSVTVAFHAEP